MTKGFMRILNPEKDLSEFFDSLSRNQSRALVLDYDGTLAPFVARRDKAFPYPGVTEILSRIIQKGRTRLVLLTGRSLHDLIPLLGLERTPEIWGSHGGERLLPDGTYHKAALPESTVMGLEAATEWIAGKGWGGLLELKPFGFALHWRGRKPEETAEIERRVQDYLPDLVDETKFSLYEFDGGLELRPRGINKGKALDTILAEMEDTTLVAYLGDDFTDEDAFGALKGRGLAVLVREELRETMADLWIQPPEELLDFLKRWERAIS